MVEHSRDAGVTRRLPTSGTTRPVARKLDSNLAEGNTHEPVDSESVASARSYAATNTTSRPAGLHRYVLKGMVASSFNSRHPSLF
jgi:hypothetical protein